MGIVVVVRTDSTMGKRDDTMWMARDVGAAGEVLLRRRR